MKKLIKKIVVWKINFIARMYLWRFKPVIVAVTGNVGKTSTKEAIAVVLSKIKRVRSGKGNLNNEFGVPLAIVGDWADEYYETGNSALFWLKVLVVSCWSLVVSRNYPEVLVLEYGADKPGDIKKLAKKFRPDISVVTAVGEIPVHVEFFSSPEGLAKEKSKLVEALSSSGHAILNHDDPTVLEMKHKTKAKVMTYGFSEGAEVRLSNFNYRIENDKPEGVTFKINHGTSTFVPAVISGTLGKSQAYCAGAAAAVGLAFGMNLVDISEALVNYEGPKGRLKIIPGIKNSTIIDDTYNAAPASTHLAIDTLISLPAKRRVAILGDMLELGKYSIQAHQEVGNLAGGKVDLLITSGDKAKFIADAARNQMDNSKILALDNSDEVKNRIIGLVEEGDLILVKGSQGARMEKVVKELMSHPLEAKNLLVRQGKKWLTS